MNANDTHDASAPADGIDFLLARIGRDAFALPVAQVQEIVTVDALTPLPHAPQGVRGLMQVGGRILPLLDVARLTGIADDGGMNAVIVTTPQGACALRVDEVLARVTVPGETLRRIATGDGLVNAELEHDGRPVLAIDPARLGQLLATDALPPGEAGLLGETEAGIVTTHEDAQVYLAFHIGGSRYALPLTEVGEAIPAPPFTAIPGAPPTVAGICLLRDTPLLAVSGACLLEVTAAVPGAALVMDDGTLRVALLVDEILGVERIAAADTHPLEEADADIVAVAHDAHGRLTALLSRDALLSPARRQAWSPLAPAVRDTQSVLRRSLRAHLEARLGDERIAIPLDEVRRIVAWHPPENIEGSVTQAGGDGFAVGAISVDGRVLPVLDPRRLQPRADGMPDGAWIVVGEGDAAWAVAVSEACRIVQVPVDDIESLGGDNRFLQGVANVNGTLLSLATFSALSGGRFAAGSGA